jgi:hypothetical protein
MEKIKDLINRFIDIEQKSGEALNRNDIKIYNNLVDKIFELSGPNVKLANKEEISISEPEEIMDDSDEDIPVYSRHLYKISEYSYSKYGAIWACYTSVSDPEPGLTKLLSNLFILACISEQPKIIAQLKIDPDTYKWRFVGGDRDIDYYELGDPIAVERLLSPENDKWSIEEYLKDK